MAKQPLCMAPWAHLYIDNDGWVYLCCRTERPEEAQTPEELKLARFFEQFSFLTPSIWDTPTDASNESLRKTLKDVQENGDEWSRETLEKLTLLAGRHSVLSRPLGNIREQNLQEIWESPYLDEMRKTFQKGQFPDKQCWRCQWELVHGVPETQVLLTHFNNTYPAKETLKSFHAGPASLNVHLGNLCNLKCLMCNPKYSSRHAGGKLIDPYTGNTKFLESFKAFLPNLRHINFGGGEPLINENLFRYLDLIVKAKTPIKVAYVTNLTVLNKRLLKIMPKIYQNEFHISIDGVGANYESIRQGARWKNVHANLREIALNRKKYRITEFLVKMCVMPRNYVDVEALMDVCQELDLPLQFNLVYYPETLSPFKRPPDERKKIKDHLAELAVRRKSDIAKVCVNYEALSVI